MASASGGSDKSGKAIDAHGDHPFLTAGHDHINDYGLESSGGGQCASDSGSVDLPSALLGPAGDTRGSSSQNLSANDMR